MVKMKMPDGSTLAITDLQLKGKTGMAANVAAYWKPKAAWNYQGDKATLLADEIQAVIPDAEITANDFDEDDDSDAGTVY